MALDDKVFQSAIAKINKMKSRQSPISSQIKVFEDPPHLKKKPEISSDSNSVITEQIEKLSSYKKENSPLAEEKSENENKISINKLPAKEGTERGTKGDTKYSTERGTKSGTNNPKRKNEVQQQGTDIGTEKGTEKGYKNKLISYSGIPEDFGFTYNRPYDSLEGIPKKIVDIIFEICRKYNIKETPPIPIAMLVRLCNEKKNSVIIARKRLTKAGIIITKEPANTRATGRSAMLVYKLRDDLFEEIHDSLSLFMRNETINKKGTKYGTERGTEASSSSNYIKPTTTELPQEWRKIDITPLNCINFGFIELKNIYRKCPNNINHEIVQDSINQFAFGLANNSDRYKTMNAPSAILVKTLSEGIPWKENGYISSEEKQRLEKEEKAIKFLEQQFKEPKFFEWFNSLDEKEIDNLVPQGEKSSTSYLVSKSIIQKEYAQKYFEESIWPSILSKLKTTL